MTDELERQLELWMRERVASPSEIDRLLAIPLPARVGGIERGLRLLAPIGALVAVIVLAVFGLSRLGAAHGVAAQPSGPTPFAIDPRITRCGTPAGASVMTTFEMAHGADYQAHLPAMGKSPELDVPDPAFVVIYDQPATGTGSSDLIRSVCVLLGNDPATAQINLYSDVDITGMRSQIP